MTAALAGGFAEPVFDAQAVFRAVMSAIARPGTLIDLPERARPPAPLSPEAGAIALALFDHETPVWCDPALARVPTVRDWLAFHTGAPLVERPDEAAFALIREPLRMPALSAFGLGTAEYPDRSTTLVVAVDSFDGPARLTLAGPGIETRAILAPAPLPPAFAGRLHANHALFPRGVDLLFTAPGRLAALPRSTRIEEN